VCVRACSSVLFICLLFIHVLIDNDDRLVLLQSARAASSVDNADDVDDDMDGHDDMEVSTTKKTVVTSTMVQRWSHRLAVSSLSLKQTQILIGTASLVQK